jgi:7-carboxy-7-deazaguanine synthase
MTTLKVNEIFGPVVQGEGPHTGRHTLFLRLANCNLTCAWCDTAFTWAFTEAKAKKHEDNTVYDKQKEVHEKTAEEVLQDLNALYPYPTTVTISGGEPLMQVPALCELADKSKRRYRFEVETAGTISPGMLSSWVDSFVVSPKLSNSGNLESKRLKWHVLEEFTVWHWSKTWFKFVVTDASDLSEIDEIVKRLEFPPYRVFVMPEGRTPEAIIQGGRELWKPTLKRGYNLSLRTQTLLWSDERER